MGHFLSRRSAFGGDEGSQRAPGKPALVMENSLGLRTAWSARPVRLIIYFGFVLVMAIAAAGAVAILNLRDNVIAGRERQLQTTAAVLANHFENTFEALTLTQRRFVQQVQALNIESAEDFERRMAGHDIHVLLKDSIVNLRPVHALMLASAGGKIINFSRDWPVPSDSIAHRAYFKAFLASPGMPYHISMPLRNSATGAWIFHAAYRVVGSNGAFLGLVIGVIELRHFEQLFATLGLEPGSSLALVRRDGMVLVRYPELDMGNAPSYASNPLFRDVLPKAARGVVRLTSQFDHQERFVIIPPP